MTDKQPLTPQQRFDILFKAYSEEYQMRGNSFICPGCKKKVPQEQTVLSKGKVTITCEHCGEEREYEAWKFDPVLLKEELTLRIMCNKDVVKSTEVSK